MNTKLRWIIGIGAAVVIGLGLFLGGIFLGRFGWGMAMSGTVPYGMMGSAATGYGNTASRDYGVMGPGMMAYGYDQDYASATACGDEMMWPEMMGYNYGETYSDTIPYGCEMMGSGMMGMMGGGFGPGMMGMMGGGMMGGRGSGALYGIQPLSLAEAQAAVEDYLVGLDDDDLALGEVMIFENHAYAQVIEESTGIGAFEVLVDPVTQAVFPEPGPNMMWNAKYGHMGNLGMMGTCPFEEDEMMESMMGSTTASEISAADDMPVSSEEASETAQRYLDTYLPGAQADDEADAFYGYYTIHILRDGQTVGMLSVNGYTRQVFVHTWHGDLVDMAEDTHD